MAKFPRLVGLKDYTHYLRIPLATPASIPQFRHSWMRFQNDASLTVPSAAICNPDFYHILVARLKLLTSRDVDDVSAILRNYDMRRALKDAATALRPSTSLELTTSRVSIVEKNDLHAGVLPLRINVLGLGAGEGRNPASAVNLRAKVIDPTYRLPHFLLSPEDFLTNAGFMVSPRNTVGGRRDLGDNVLIVNTFLVYWNSRSGYFNKKLGVWVKYRPEVPKIDARDLIDKYHGHQWGTDITLEKICLEKLGSTAKRSDGTAVQKGSTVVATFELP